MKKLIADVWKHPQGFLSAKFYCHDVNDQLDRSTTQTLLSLVKEAVPPSDADLAALIEQAKAGRYVPLNPSLPDWGVNDKNVWLVAPMAKPGHICISNENTDEYSTEQGGEPQQFTYEQFRIALQHWREFQALIAREGKDRLVDQRYESEFPD